MVSWDRVQEEGEALGYALARVFGIHEDNNNYKDCEVSWSLLTALKVLVIMIGSEQSVVISHYAMKINIPLWKLLRTFFISCNH